jgi:DNA-binding transcriptional MerR regulator/methylmalonyl-CoA mutase cobalamin-binding subunit
MGRWACVARGKFTVNEVEERTKVPASTLRQWERRYGVPKPERSESGYRLYSEQDLDHIEAMKEHIAEGIPASRAADLVKRLKPVPKGPRSLQEMREELVGALLTFDEARADEIFSEAHALHTVEAVMLELMQGTLVETGDLWHDGKISVATEHFVSSYLHGRLRILLSISGNNHAGATVIVACAPQEQHELGALILAVMLRRSGYRVFYLGANTPLVDLAQMAKGVRAAAVMLSASTQESLDMLLHQREVVRDMAPVVAFGGAAVDQQPELVYQLGGIYLAGNVVDAVKRFQECMKKGVVQA